MERKAAPILQDGGADLGDGKRRHFLKMATFSVPKISPAILRNWRSFPHPNQPHRVHGFAPVSSKVSPAQRPKMSRAQLQNLIPLQGNPPSARLGTLRYANNGRRYLHPPRLRFDIAVASPHHRRQLRAQERAHRERHGAEGLHRFTTQRRQCLGMLHRLSRD